MTGRHSALIRRIVLRLAGSDNHRLLSLTGPVVLIFSVLAWALLMWAGWVLIFTSSPTALRQAHTHQIATLGDRIYFTGSTLFTLGNGDFSPQGPWWELATAVASLSGLFLVTLAVTYILAVIEAVVQKRSFASQVAALGKSPAEFVMRCWNGAAFPQVELQIVSLTEQLNMVTEQHTAYPLLHYYHEFPRRQSVPLGLAIFAEAVSIFERAVEPAHRPAPAALHCARDSIHDFLTTLKDAYIDPSETDVPPPPLDPLRGAGIPVCSDDHFAARLEELEEDRRLLMAFLESERREWPGQSGRQAGGQGR
jgi:hypothetical protein